MIVKLLTEQCLEFLSLKIGCRGSSESTHVKMPHCWKSHALACLSIHSSHRFYVVTEHSSASILYVGENRKLAETVFICRLIRAFAHANAISTKLTCGGPSEY